jgi:DNA-binding transcriptional LysR family regulator
VTSVVVEGRVQVASAEGVMACVRAALGIAVVSRWMCRAELERGDVRQIHVAQRSPQNPFSTVSVKTDNPQSEDIFSAVPKADVRVQRIIFEGTFQVGEFAPGF